MRKKLIINSDDFGLTVGVNDAIVKSIQNKAISSCSLMVNVPGTMNAIQLMQEYNLQNVGVHINVTLGQPVSPIESIPSLVDSLGCFHPSKWWNDHSVNPQELITEFVAQINRFKQLTGIEPVHINYHHMIDFYGLYPSLYMKMIEYNKPLRCERFRNDYPFKHIKSLKETLEVGNYDFLKKISDDIVELPCHIGFVDEDLKLLTSLTDQRMVDYEVVNSIRFKNAIRNAGFEYGSWNDAIKD